MQTTVSVRRWRRYGADRVVVTGATGALLGSVDLRSGDLDEVEHGSAEQVREAVAAYLRRDDDVVLVPRQRPGADGLTDADLELLAQWLGETTERSAPSGATGRELERLGDLGWTVVHDLPIGLQGTACAHLLVGRAGVFTVRAVDAGRVPAVLDGLTLWCDGRRTSALRDAALEAARVRTLLLRAGAFGLPVTPVLVCVGRLLRIGPERGTGQLVLPLDRLVGRLRALPTALRPDEEQALGRIARRPGTWTP